MCTGSRVKYSSNNEEGAETVDSGERSNEPSEQSPNDTTPPPENSYTETSEADCSDGIDNDIDGDVDCSDPGCSETNFCRNFAI